MVDFRRVSFNGIAVLRSAGVVGHAASPGHIGRLRLHALFGLGIVALDGIGPVKSRHGTASGCRTG